MNRSEAAPEGAILWDEIPEGCEVRRCLDCQLVYLSGPDQTSHYPYCPERKGRPVLMWPFGLDIGKLFKDKNVIKQP